MEALEAEQNHIDTRAGVVERKLRQLLETGKMVECPTGTKEISLKEFMVTGGCTVGRS